MVLIKIGNRNIGKNFPVFIIAEAGVNYNNNLKYAYKMIDCAKKAGADAIKFQTFVTELLQLPSTRKPNYQRSIKSKSYFEILKSLEPNFDDQRKIFNYCKKKKIQFLSTPYDERSIDFLESINVPAYKISSSDLSNHILLEYISKKRKPVFLSTGLSNFSHIVETVNFLKKLHLIKKLILLHTTSDYPTKPSDVNLHIISKLSDNFKVPIGFSDHTSSDTASIGAVALGACVIEKHFTLDRNLPGPDQSSSLEPDELKSFIKKIRILEKSLGNSKKIITNSERNNLSMKKFLVIKSAKKDSIITFSMLTALRGNGKILPTHNNIKKIIGKKLVKSILKPSPFNWSMITNSEI
jgi:N,N'-diacetyllegionaminate synthase